MAVKKQRKRKQGLPGTRAQANRKQTDMVSTLEAELEAIGLRIKQVRRCAAACRQRTLQAGRIGKLNHETNPALITDAHASNIVDKTSYSQCWIACCGHKPCG